MALAMTPRPQASIEAHLSRSRHGSRAPQSTAAVPLARPRLVALPSRAAAGSEASSSRAARRPPAVYRRRRLAAGFVVGLAIAVVILVVVMGGASATSDAPSTPPSAPAVYVVQPGDTLWRIVERLAPQRDPRPLVASLQKATGGSQLRPGQRIVLPPSLQP